MWCSGERTVERTKNEGQTDAALFRRKQAGGQKCCPRLRALRHSSPLSRCFKSTAGQMGLRMQANRVEDIRARDGELQRVVRIAKKNMLALVGRLQDGCTTGQCREFERRCRRRGRQPFRNERQHMDAPERTPEYDRSAATRLRETEHPSVTGRRPTRPYRERVGETKSCNAGAQRSDRAGTPGCGVRTPKPTPAASGQRCSRMIFHPANRPDPRQSGDS